MSFIQFESARAKDKARQELRDAREQMLEEAKKRAEQRAEREAQKHLKGEKNWMLPSVEKKLKKESKEAKKSKKKKDKKKSKKSNKKTRRKRKHTSSSSDDSGDSDSSSSSDNDDSASSQVDHKRRKKSKKSKKKKSKIKHSSSDSESEETGDESSKNVEVKKVEQPIQRDSWMTGAFLFKTYSKERVENKPSEKQQIDTYDPAKSSRELNPYWKTTGTGLPAFQKPKDEDDYKSNRSEKSVFSLNTSSSKGWRKQNQSTIPNELATSQRKKLRTPSDKEDSSTSSDETSKNEVEEKSNSTTSEFLTDQQMNELGAKILKAELMGNMSLANELREKLEKARTQRNIYKERQKTAYLEGKNKSVTKPKTNQQDEHILLTHTDQTGNTRPLPSSKTVDPRDLYGGRKKHKQKRVNTHNELGDRVRYFADDDRYDLKTMFEREKYTSASDANLQFANIAGKHKNPNDDMEDIFAEKISQDDSTRSDRKERERAIREHQKIEKALDNCDKCFDSIKMQKELLISVGEKVYLALPWHQGLQPGHCMIIPNQHASCCTQIDEDTWSEISDFRKALTRMFAAQRKDVIFFEIANRLHKRPHLVIHCIPIRDSDGEMAPFYFKKAIEESEHEWCVNKQLVSLRQKSLRSAIPKGLPYFWVHFGMDTGFAHVIEDEDRFPPNFAQEIIGGMLNLDANKWRRLQKEQNIVTKVKMFADWWKKYDCTK